MNLFEKAFYKTLDENINVAGGADGVFGTGTQGPIGSFGNQFPSQNDNAYAPGDARVPKIIGMGKKKKKEKIAIQRRPLPGLGKEVVN